MKAKKTAHSKKSVATRKPKLAVQGKVVTRKSKALVIQKPVQPAKNKRHPTTSGLPEILFEGDRPGAHPTGPGKRYTLGPTAPQEQFIEEGELPEAYGTRQLLVTARDPHWLYAHWDLTREQLRQYNALSAHKHLVLRLSCPDHEESAAGEVHVHPESRHWFVHVAEAGVRYTVDLGYYGKSKGWTSISKSAPTLAPPDVVSGETKVQFATIPSEVALSRLVDIVKRSAVSNPALAHAIEEIRLAGHPELPPLGDGSAAKPWTAEQERALAEIIHARQFGNLSVGSLDVTELVRRELSHDFNSIMVALGGPGGISSLSSPHGGAPTGPGEFWFNVNAELIIYGATEPTANVSIGGHKVALRPDGSFSYRFALPDGQYELPVTAVSADGTEARHADLQFSRSTSVVGDVGQHPQDPALKTPASENVS
jgi:hypothetical protein